MLADDTSAGNGDVIVETPRLRLRRLVHADLPFMTELFGSLEVMRFSLTGPLARGQAEQILTQFLESYSIQPLGQWGVAEKATGNLIGLSGFLRRDSADANEWELAYRFLPGYWGLGYATEAAIACRDIALKSPHASQITAMIEPANIASIQVAENVELRPHLMTQLQGIPVLKFILRQAAAT